MNKYTVYRTTESSIELEGKSVDDIHSQMTEIDCDDEAWVYDDETFEVIEHGDGERINNSDCGCKDCGKTHCDSKCICGACEKCLDSSCKDCGKTLPICACAISN